MTHGSFRGVLSPVISPNTPDGDVDGPRFQSICKWQLSHGVDGLAIFGTTSEANSIAISERLRQTEALVASGVPAEKLMPGTGTCSLGDTVALTRQAVSLGAGGVLLMPPFYFKGVQDDGLFAYVSEIIRQVADERLKIYLYHIPPQAVIGWSLPLIRRLIEAYPQTISGLKDSSGDWSHTQAVLEGTRDFEDFDVFPGSEMFLLEALKNGGAGCISATANVNGAGIRAVIDAFAAGDQDALKEAEERMRSIRAIFQAYAPIPAVKAAIAACTEDREWHSVRLPLQDLSPGATADLMAKLHETGFTLSYKGLQDGYHSLSPRHRTIS